MKKAACQFSILWFCALASAMRCVACLIFETAMRVLPSGRPPEEEITLVQEDPTWAIEYVHFKEMVQSGWTTDLSGDIWLHRVLSSLGERVVEKTGAST